MGRKLYVGNLPYSADQQSLTEIFSRCGTVDSVNVIADRDTGQSKGFGFIDTGTGQDMFFHLSSLEGVTYEELQEGQRVEYTEGQGPKGPRAENVRPI